MEPAGLGEGRGSVREREKERGIHSSTLTIRTVTDSDRRAKDRP
jgi:hypothetical protein